jgi:hypothetical protein
MDTFIKAQITIKFNHLIKQLIALGIFGFAVFGICLQQPICDDVMLIYINLLTFIAVIYSDKSLFLFIFSAQICVLKHQNSLAPPHALGQSSLPRV